LERIITRHVENDPIFVSKSFKSTQIEIVLSFIRNFLFNISYIVYSSDFSKKYTMTILIHNFQKIITRRLLQGIKILSIARDSVKVKYLTFKVLVSENWNRE